MVVHRFFDHNDSSIKKTVQDLIALIRLRNGKKAIDIGTGTNTAVAERLAQLGIEAHMLDSMEGYDSERDESQVRIVPA